MRGVQAIPILLLSPIAGFMFVLLAVLIITGEIQPWHVYVTAFGMAAVQTFEQPAHAAIISDVVPTKNLTNAIGLNSIIFNVARSTGPALGCSC